MGEAASLQQRVAEVKRRLPIGEVVSAEVKLSGSAGTVKRRGKCPFHGSNSPSFAVDSCRGAARCYGCQWSGDVIDFVADMRGLPFAEALRECEALAGIAAEGTQAEGRGPVRRARNPVQRRARELVEPIEMGRWIWGHAVRDDDAVRRYFMGRGIPDVALSADRLTQFRFLAECPCMLWEAGQAPREAKAMLFAPALVAMVREACVIEGSGGPFLEWIPVGVHVTYLSPDGAGTMRRRKPWAKDGDPDPWLPKRRMLGPVGRGAVVLGDYRPDAELWIGEGNETVLSAIALSSMSSARPSGRASSALFPPIPPGSPEHLRAGGRPCGPIGADVPYRVGLATLSLDNLQGRPRAWKGGVLPLHDIRPDPERPPFLVPGHRGPVVGLVDSDMSPLRGMRDRRTGEFLGEAVVERKGGPIVRRAITGAERARICGELIVKGWRDAGCEARAIRAPAGMDFNDVVQQQGETV